MQYDNPSMKRTHCTCHRNFSRELWQAAAALCERSNDSTRKRYEGAQERYHRWCREHQVDIWEVTKTHAIMYLAERSRECKSKQVKQEVPQLSLGYLVRDKASPFDHPLVVEACRNLSSVRDGPIRRRLPLRMDMLRAMQQKYRGGRTGGVTFRHYRIVACAWLAFFFFLRASEVVGTPRRAVKVTPYTDTQGRICKRVEISVYRKKKKTTQELSSTHPELVKVVETYLKYRGNKDGPLFCMTQAGAARQQATTATRGIFSHKATSPSGDALAVDQGVYKHNDTGPAYVAAEGGGMVYQAE